MKISFSTHRPWCALARVTASEILRQKILYNTVVVTVLCLAASFLAAQLTFIQPERVLLDFSLFSMSIAGALLGILNGAPLLAKEIERRTYAVALSRPISMTTFIIGKFLGLSWVLGLNFLLLGGLQLGLYASQGGKLQGIHFLAVFLLYLQSLLFSALAIFFTSFSTVSLSVVYCLALYVIGNSLSDFLKYLDVLEKSTLSPLLVKGFRGIAYLLPNLDHYHLDFLLTYRLPVESDLLWTSLLYTLFLVSLLLGVSSRISHRRELS